MLSIKNLSKEFHGKKVLRSVSFDVGAGKVVVLLGSSGLGKSTLLRVLCNLETPDSGTVYLEGKPLDLSTVNRTHMVGMVFQQFNLFDHLTVEQNITLPLEKAGGMRKKEAKKIAHDLLAHYQLADKANMYPSQLSGGQKQRLAIARSTARKPRIICLDEPTSALDPLLTTHVANAIQELGNEGYIVLVASHDTALLEKLDCTIHLMEHGEIIESATSQALKENKNAYPRIARFVAGTI